MVMFDLVGELDPRFFFLVSYFDCVSRLFRTVNVFR